MYVYLQQETKITNQKNQITMKTEMVIITGVKVKAETKAAYLVKFWENEAWVPKSISEYNGKTVLRVAKWFYEKNLIDKVHPHQIRK